MIANRFSLAAILIAALCCADVVELAIAADEPADRFQAAEAFLRDGKYAEATVEYQAFLASAPHAEAADTARFRLGETAFLAKDYVVAHRELTAFVEAAPQHAALPRALHYLGEAAYACRDFVAAERALAWRSAIIPDDELARRTVILQACSLMQLGESRAAWTVLTPTYWGDRKANDAWIDFLVASLATSLGEDDAAVDAYESYLSRGNSAERKFEAHTALAELHRRHGRWEKAASSATAAITAATKQQLPATLALQADIAEEGGETALSEATLARLLQEFPKHELATKASVRYAELAAEAGDWTTAAERYAAVCKRDDLKDDVAAEAWSARLHALAQDKQWRELFGACDEARTCVFMREHLHEIDYLAGRAQVARAELDEARESLQRSASSPLAAGTEVGALAQLMTAETFFLQRRYDEALTEYAAVAKFKQPHWHSAAELQRGKCYEQLHRPDEAIRTYEALARDFADSSYVDEAVRRRDACRAVMANAATNSRK